MAPTESERITRLEEKIDAINKRLDRVIDDHEERIRQLEVKPARHWEAVVAALISTGVGAAIGFFLAALK